MLQEILTENSLELKQLDGFAFGAGPGSFTGLRIACGIAQGLAYATERPIAAISTLKAIAQRVNHNKVVVALDARMGEIYHAAYEKTNRWITVSEATICLPKLAPPLNGSNWTGCGSGFDLYEKELSKHYSGQIHHINRGLYPSCSRDSKISSYKVCHRISY